jgi:hypothetical protein
METSKYQDLLYLKPGQKPNLHYLVLSALLEGEHFTTLTALQKFRTLEARKIISDLRAIGVPIADRWSTNPGSKKRFKIYYLGA